MIGWSVAGSPRRWRGSDARGTRRATATTGAKGDGARLRYRGGSRSQNTHRLTCYTQRDGVRFNWYCDLFQEGSRAEARGLRPARPVRRGPGRRELGLEPAPGLLTTALGRAP